MNENNCFVALLSIELLIPQAQSLKDKRRQVRGLKDRIRSRFNAAVAETDYQDKWQRALLSVALVGNDRRQLESDCARIRTLCEEIRDITVSAVELAWL